MGNYWARPQAGGPEQDPLAGAALVPDTAIPVPAALVPEGPINVHAGADAAAVPDTAAAGAGAAVLPGPQVAALLPRAGAATTAAAVAAAAVGLLGAPAAMPTDPPVSPAPPTHGAAPAPPDPNATSLASLFATAEQNDTLRRLRVWQPPAVLSLEEERALVQLQKDIWWEHAQFFELLEEQQTYSGTQWLDRDVPAPTSDPRWPADGAKHAFDLYICIQDYLEDRISTHLGHGQGVHEFLWRLPVSIDLSGSRTSLNLSGCSELMVVPANSIGQLLDLSSLDLSLCTKLRKLPDSISKLASLSSLNLSHCEQLGELPNSISQLARLSSLNLSHCKELRTLPESIGQLASLSSLNLSHCKELRTLPESICQLASLSSLNLSDCVRLPQLPNTVRQLCGLVHLDLSNCRQLQMFRYDAHLPDSFSHLTNLTSLSLSGCTQLQLPPYIGRFRSLVNLNLSGSSCTEGQLPHFSQLTKLTSLSLSGCTQLQRLPPEISQCPNLASLDLSSCRKLQELPSFSQLKALTSLGLSGCTELRQLPAFIDELPGLQSHLSSLDLSGLQRLQQLPAKIGQLGNLTSLNLSGCCSLTRLPATVGQLRYLSTLDVSGCSQLEQLPDLSRLLELEEFDTPGCPKVMPVPSDHLPPKLQERYPDFVRKLGDTLAQALTAISWIAILLATASFVGFVTVPGGSYEGGLVQLAALYVPPFLPNPLPAPPAPRPPFGPPTPPAPPPVPLAPPSSHDQTSIPMHYTALRAYFFCNVLTFMFAISTNMFVVTYHMPHSSRLTIRHMIWVLYVANLLLVCTVLCGVATFISGVFAVYPDKLQWDMYAALYFPAICLITVLIYWVIRLWDLTRWQRSSPVIPVTFAGSNDRNPDLPGILAELQAQGTRHEQILKALSNLSNAPSMSSQNSIYFSASENWHP